MKKTITLITAIAVLVSGCGGGAAEESAGNGTGDTHQVEQVLNPSEYLISRGLIDPDELDSKVSSHFVKTINKKRRELGLDDILISKELSEIVDVVTQKHFSENGYGNDSLFDFYINEKTVHYSETKGFKSMQEELQKRGLAYFTQINTSAEAFGEGSNWKEWHENRYEKAKNTPLYKETNLVCGVSPEYHLDGELYEGVFEDKGFVVVCGR